MRTALYGPVPWLVPGVLAAMAIGFLVARRLGRALSVHPAVAFAMIVSLGLIVATTLTPLRVALDFGATGVGSCDLSRLAPLAPGGWLRLSEASLNIAMFVPLGITIGFMPQSRVKTAIVAMAFAFPFVIELVQLTVPVMARGCESADVIDNLSGLLVGLTAGALTRWLTVDRAAGRPASGADPDQAR
jgi:hypothetical protein